jgi:hypothetical protein
MRARTPSSTALTAIARSRVGSTTPAKTPIFSVAQDLAAWSAREARRTYEAAPTPAPAPLAERMSKSGQLPWRSYRTVPKLTRLLFLSVISRLGQGAAALLAAATLYGCPLVADDPYEFVEADNAGSGGAAASAGASDTGGAAGSGAAPGGGAASANGGAAESGGAPTSGGASTGGGASTNGGAPTTGDAGDDGMGISPCGVAAEPPAGTCPTVCTGGCRGSTCLIACLGDQQCKEAIFVCPPGFACEVACVGAQACEKASITCPERYACSFACDGTQACKDAKLRCADGNCQITCGLNNACEHTEFQCGAGACSAFCAGSVPSVRNCAEACSCTAC